jgi:hypothetical protein
VAELHFCLNATSTHADGTLIEGGQLDRYLRPVWEALDERGVEYTVGREPRNGAVNVYPNTRATYQRGSHRLDAVSIGVSHGIADKTYHDGYVLFGHVFVPGPAHAAAIGARARLAPRRWRAQMRQLGYPKLDPLLNGAVDGSGVWSGDGRTRVLYAPTHGGGSERHVHGNRAKPGSRATSWWIRDDILAALPEDEFEVVLAPHPRHAEGRQATFAEYVEADVVIADGGSTIYESWILGRPVVLPAWETRGRNVGRGARWGGTLEQRVYEERVGAHADAPGDIADLVRQAARDGQTDAEQDFAEEVLPTQYRGRGGVLWAETLAEIAAATPTPRSRLTPQQRVAARRAARQAQDRSYQERSRRLTRQ